MKMESKCIRVYQVEETSKQVNRRKPQKVKKLTPSWQNQSKYPGYAMLTGKWKSGFDLHFR